MKIKTKQISIHIQLKPELVYRIDDLVRNRSDILNRTEYVRESVVNNLENNIHFRLKESVIKELKTIAELQGIDEIILIKKGINNFLDNYDQNDLSAFKVVEKNN